MVTASFCCGLFANMQSAQAVDFENLPLDLPIHISHQNGATYHHTLLHNLRHYSCERVSITKLTEIATYCTSLCAVEEGVAHFYGARSCPALLQGGGLHVRLRFVQQIVGKVNKLGSYHVKNSTPQLILASVSNKVYPEKLFTENRKITISKA